MKKFNFKTISIFGIIAVILIISGCSTSNNKGIPDVSAPSSKQSIVPSNSQTSTAPATESGLKIFTKEELKKYDGKNGNPAYIAIEGKVYDVTNAPGWNQGMHRGVEAGNDLTEEMKNSPHGLSKLESVKVIGLLK